MIKLYNHTGYFDRQYVKSAVGSGFCSSVTP